MIHKIDGYFRDLTKEGFQPRDFQRETIDKILQRQNTLLRAPTGAGKMETAIAPFLLARHLGIQNFPRKLIYIVPLRTLANSLRERTQEMIRRWETKYPPQRSLVVTLQTGENSEDPRFEGDIIFCTIDQLLSSFLNIPYSVGRGSANVNAGVVFASYLVFDELHLLDPNRSFATTLKLLQQINSISPFLLMTATLTNELSQQIQQEVGASTLHLVTVTEQDLTDIEGNRKRNFQISNSSLSAMQIVQDMHQYRRRRIIVICNTVAQAQGLFQDLQTLNLEAVDLILLHARFLPSDRAKKEALLEQVFGKDWRKQESDRTYILISTQVIEAGINITCEVMHSLLCPVNSLLQRAGRCARFVIEEGAVYVYRDVSVSESQVDLAQADDDDEVEAKTERRSKHQFLPYDDDLCESTWKVLVEYAASDLEQQAIGYKIEADWVNQVHWQQDQKQAEKRKNSSGELYQKFKDAIFAGERSASKYLIRLVDNRSIFVWDTPDVFIDGGDNVEEIRLETLQPFSLPKATLCKLWRESQDTIPKGSWLFKRIEMPQGKDAEIYKQPSLVSISRRDDLVNSLRILVNPRYVYYDDKIGLLVNSGREGNFTSPEKFRKKASHAYSYHMDTYIGHLGRMWTCWQKAFPPKSQHQQISVQEELLLAGGRFIQQKLFQHARFEETAALFELLVFLAVITHDLGKLQKTWQVVMRGWQAIAHSEFQQTDPANHLLAHTDYDPDNRILKKRYDDYMDKNERPAHAVESAFLAFEILNEVLYPIMETVFQADGEVTKRFCNVVEMAAGRHHSAWAKGWYSDNICDRQPLKLCPGADRSVLQSWQQLVKRLSPETRNLLSIPELSPLSQTTYDLEEFKLDCFTPDDIEYQQLYWLVVRALRLCDARSVQLH